MFCKIITFINKIIFLGAVDYADLNVRNSSAYKLGLNLGFFIAFLLFASIIYFVMDKFHKIPSFIIYSKVITLVIVAFAIGKIILKLRR